MAWVSAGLAAAQLVAGGVKAIKNTKDQKKKDARMASATGKMVSEARNLKNITQGAGMDQAQAEARQTQADTIGQAALRTDDPNKLLATTSATNLQGLKAGQQRDAVTQGQRLQGQRDYVSALSGQEAQENRIDDNRIKQQYESEAVSSNLIGAGVENFANKAKDDFMVDAASRIEKGESIEELMANRRKLPFQGSGWKEKLDSFIKGLGKNKQQNAADDIMGKFGNAMKTWG